MRAPDSRPAFRTAIWDLSFRLGEITLATWRASVIVLMPAHQDNVHWPPAAEALATMVPPDCSGMVCRGVDAASAGLGPGRHGKWLRYVPKQGVRYVTRTEGSFEGYLKGFSAKARQNLKRSVRRHAERQGDQPAWQLYRQPEDMRRFHEGALAISRNTYQTRLLDAGLDDSAAFLLHMESLARQDCARGYLLMDGGRAVAYAWCTRTDDELLYDTVGYLPEHAEHSPGSVLLYHVIEQAFADPDVHVVDFGEGEATYKAMFSTEHRALADVFFFPPTLKNAFLIRAHWAVLRCSSAIGALLQKHGLKQGLKTWIRRLHGT
ncbi:MAG: GNAT family N-acetyltransferase [Ideonella sp.]|nr:GNAT family N-acetyltransferase [Ideonella sp.]